MDERTLKLPVGLQVGDELVKEVPVAETSGMAEEVYTSRPSETKLYTWFGEIIAVSLSAIGKDPVASEFAKTFNSTRTIPKAVRRLPLNDVGSLIIQIQRECWEDTIEKVQVPCRMCSKIIETDVDLNRIPIPETENEVYEHVLIKLSSVYKIDTSSTGAKQLEQYDGLQFNALKLRVPTLEDAIKREKLNGDEVAFWKNIIFDCLISLQHLDEDGAVLDEIDDYHTKRGLVLLKKDLKSKDLKKVRSQITGSLPSMKFFYEDTCACGKYEVPIFAPQANFFSA